MTTPRRIREVVHHEQALGVAARQWQRREGPGALGEVTGDRPIWKPENRGPSVAAIWAIIWLSPRSRPSPIDASLATIGSMSGRHCASAAIVEGGTVDRDDGGVDRHPEQRIDVTRDERREFLEALALDGEGFGSPSSPRAMFSASWVAVVNQASGPCWPDREKMSPNMPPKGLLSLITTI